MRRAIKIPLSRLRKDFRFRQYLNGQTSKHVTPAQAEYYEYLASEHWIRFREKIFAKRGPQCEECGTVKGRLDLHHLTYERRGRELPQDVKILCSACHENQHAKAGKS